MSVVFFWCGFYGGGGGCVFFGVGGWAGSLFLAKHVIVGLLFINIHPSEYGTVSLIHSLCLLCRFLFLVETKYLTPHSLTSAIGCVYIL